MAAAESKSGNSGQSSNWPEEVVDSVEREEKKENSGVKSSWSGWFQRVNDAILNAMPVEDENKEKAEDNTETKTGPQEKESEDKEGSWGTWGSSFLKQAKEKTMTTLELVKKDLTEFTDAVHNETAQIVSSTTNTIRERAPGLMGSIVDTVNTVLLVDDTTRGEHENEVPITAADVAEVYANRKEARLYAIQADPGTYCNEPEGAPELFDDWLDHSFNLEDKKEEISQLLVNNPTVRNTFTKLVPLEISNTTFWQRYFYKFHQMELDEARRQALLKREEVAGCRTSGDNPHLSWGDDSDPEEQPEHVENAETESFCDLSKEDDPVTSLDERSAPSNRQQSPLCGKEAPDGATAIPRLDKEADSFNVEIKTAEKSGKNESRAESLDTDSSSISSIGTAKNDAESLSPADKKSDDWVEWEGNENSS